MKLLLMAAHDRTTLALTSIVYLLGRHPEWQSSVCDELMAWHNHPGGTPVYDGLRQLIVTELVLHEGLRLYPPVVSLSRGAACDIELDNRRIPAGTSVGIHILDTHYMPDL